MRLCINTKKTGIINEAEEIARAAGAIVRYEYRQGKGNYNFPSTQKS